MIRSILKLRDRAVTLARKPSIRAVASSMFGITLARVLMLAMTAFVARRLGPSDFGTFAFATGTAEVVSQLASLGWPLLLTKMIPTYAHQRDWARLRGVNFAADMSVLAGMIVVAAGLVAIAFLFLDHANPLYIGLLFAAVLVAPSGGRLLNRQRMAAIGKAGAGIFLDRSMVPLIVLVGVVLVPMRSSLEVYGVYAVGTYVSALVARVLYRRWTHPEEFSAGKTIEFRTWTMIALPMMTAIAWRVMLNNIDVVMIAPLSSVYEVGLFNTAFRIAFVASLLPAMTSPVVRPMLAGAFAASNHKRIVMIMRNYYLFTVGLSLAIALPIFGFARLILVLAFGAKFAPAAPVLQILVAGTFFAAIAEASASYLLMCNRERIYGILSIASLLIAVALNFWLIPKWGAIGAAITSLLGNFMFLAIAVVLVARALANHEFHGRQSAEPLMGD